MNRPKPPPRKKKGLADQVLQSAKVTKAFKAKTYDVKNLPALKKAYLKHKKKAAKLKKIIQYIGAKAIDDLDSSSAEEDIIHDYISDVAMDASANEDMDDEWWIDTS